MKERATILCIRDNRILLVARQRSRWALPGGKLRRDEAPHEAALRELEEETMLVDTVRAFVDRDVYNATSPPRG